MKKNEEKTNVIRILEQNKINFKVYNYINSTAISGTEVADYLGEDYNIVFKTLVTIGKSGNHYVFLVPVNKELDLKKAAIVVEEKSIEMIKSKELLPLTGYIHGGCSPVGMKKNFTTIIESAATILPAFNTKISPTQTSSVLIVTSLLFLITEHVLTILLFNFLLNLYTE